MGNLILISKYYQDGIIEKKFHISFFRSIKAKEKKRKSYEAISHSFINSICYFGIFSATSPHRGKKFFLTTIKKIIRMTDVKRKSFFLAFTKCVTIDKMEDFSFLSISLTSAVNLFFFIIKGKYFC